jgi:hypothetical protein
VIKAGQDVWGASGVSDALRDHHARHKKRYG